jgi:glutamate synthase domain-containing protein 2
VQKDPAQERALNVLRGHSADNRCQGWIDQVTKGLAKTIRAMAEGTLDSQVGARICNGLGIMRACLETQKLEQLEARMDEIADRVARDRTNAARERTSTHEAQRPSH